MCPSRPPSPGTSVDLTMKPPISKPPSSSCGARGLRDSGFTLIELIIVLSLLGLFLGAVQETFIHGLRIVDAADERSEVDSELAWGLERLSREVAQAKTFTTATASRMVLTVDLNQDGTDETVDYLLSNGQVLRQESNRQVVLVRNAQALTFSYVDLDGNTLSVPVASGSLDDIRLVQVSVTGDLEDETVAMTTAMFVRNLFYAGAT